MNCPTCDVPLEDVDYEGVELDYCKTCGGFWLDEGELNKIVRYHEKRFAPEQVAQAKELMRRNPILGVPMEEKKVLCPHCGKECRKSASSGVHIDHCPDNAGIWLDKGELELLQIAAEECTTIFTKEQNAHFEQRAGRNGERESLGQFDRISVLFSAGA